MDLSSDNHELRSQCVVSSDLDLIGIAETHLVGHKTIKVEKYRWYAHNRTALYVNAKHVSGE